MTYDPSEEAGLRRDLPKTDPRMVDSEDTRATIWLPVAIATAPLIGLGHYFLRSDVEHEFPDARGHWRRNQASAEPELGRHRRKLVENPACAGFFRVALRCWHRTAPLIHCPSEISDVPAPFPPESHARPTVRLVEIFHPTTFVRRPNEDTFAILGGTAPSGRRNGS
jgi:hypothetical protein